MTVDDLRQIDYASLPLSDYSRNYILRLLPNIDYYLQIYNRSIDRLLSALGQPPERLAVVDFGGGHGFLSCLLKSRGIGHVIYIDHNPEAAHAAAVVKECLGYGADTILQGSSDTLRLWCRQGGIRPDGLLGMDVIEHIYRLDTFFADLFAIAPMPMVFTTGSTPYNPRVARRLHRVMKADEQGRDGQPGFRQLRRQYLAGRFPQLSANELDFWAEHTRGLRYDDLAEAVVTHTPFLNPDPFNTCDPATGSWTERILPLDDYRRLVAPHSASVTVEEGFYNTCRRGAKVLPSRLLNRLIATGRFPSLVPFIFLLVTPDNTAL